MTGTIIALGSIAVGCTIFDKIISSWGKGEPNTRVQIIQALGTGTALLLVLRLAYQAYQQVVIMF